METHTLNTHVDIYIADTEVWVSESNADSPTSCHRARMKPWEGFIFF